MITPAAALRARFDDIEKSLAVLESQMTALRAQKEQVLKDLGSLTYPVLTLLVPNEITVEIFLHVVSLLRQLYPLQPYHGPLRLASVCQTWRAVTLSTCALWNDIGILDCDGIDDAGQLLKVCLPRAGSLPLDLDIRLPEDDTSMDNIMSILSLYGSQWRRIHLSQCQPSSILPTSHFPSSLPLLESFTLTDYLEYSIWKPRFTEKPRSWEIFLFGSPDPRGFNSLIRIDGRMTQFN
ncbi:hypothetical protein GGX14DRAFT_698901 [Mycena pura]|uniref:F-box domain-containing protein n=1 Tax=Mycena pura TaxID=153505 RepID=A0AAD6V8D2_9AGAR|nr:hypothetical protein GGX14DRAFT_698901 [Mycena pura]